MRLHGKWSTHTKSSEFELKVAKWMGQWLKIEEGACMNVPNTIEFAKKVRKHLQSLREKILQYRKK